jgi:hypothetical protein
MAQRVVTYVEYTDDVDGKPFTEGEGETLAFTFDGTTYEIDLRAENAAHFREDMTKWATSARKVRKETDTLGRRVVSGSSGRRPKWYIAEVRRWAEQQGLPYRKPGSGRTPEETITAYEKAHPERAWKGGAAA